MVDYIKKNWPALLVSIGVTLIAIMIAKRLGAYEPKLLADYDSDWEEHMIEEYSGIRTPTDLTA